MTTRNPQPPVDTAIATYDGFIHRYPHLTEKTIARELGRIRAGQWRFDPYRGCWFVWSGSHWQSKRDAVVEEEVSDYCLLLTLGAGGRLTPTRIEKIQSTRHTDNILKRLRTHPLLRADGADMWDSDPFLLGTPGGTFNLKTGVLQPARPQDHITRQAIAAPGPSRARHPMWSRFLNDMTGGCKDTQRLLQQWAGINATGDTSEQKVMFLYGPGGNGKGVFLRVIAGLLGNYAKSITYRLLEASSRERHPEELAGLQGIRMAYCPEIREGMSFDEVVIKMFAGGDMVRARFMRRDSFEYRPQSSMTLSGNSQPTLRSVDASVRDRFMLLLLRGQFRRPGVEIKNLSDKILAAEAPAIMRWVADGVADWLHNGLLKVDSVEEATENYMDQENHLAAFVNAECVLEEGASVPASTLFKAWSNFANAIRQPAGSNSDFYQRITQVSGVQWKKKNTGNVYLGIKLRSLSDQMREILG